MQYPLLLPPHLYRSLYGKALPSYVRYSDPVGCCALLRSPFHLQARPGPMGSFRHGNLRQPNQIVSVDHFHQHRH